MSLPLNKNSSVRSKAMSDHFMAFVVSRGLDPDHELRDTLVPAISLAAMIAAREVTATEVMSSHLDRIADVDPAVGAMTSVLAE